LLNRGSIDGTITPGNRKNGKTQKAPDGIGEQFIKKSHTKIKQKNTFG
jgi:hypothetical protein